jgi:hypothetical protein
MGSPDLLVIDEYEDRIEFMLTEEGFQELSEEFTPENFVDTFSDAFVDLGYTLVEPEEGDYSGAMIVSNTHEGKVFTSKGVSFEDILNDIMTEGRITLHLQ